MKSNEFSKTPVNSSNTHSVTKEVSSARIEALSDGVFAIVITLLVLELKVPEIPEALVSKQLLPSLLEMLPKLISYINSFLTVGIFWVAHHNIFHLVKRSDPVLQWLNLLFLMCISFVPFPTALLGAYPHEQLAVVLYGCSFFITGIAFNLSWLYISQHHRLVDKNLSPQLIRTVTKDYIIGICAYLVPVLLSFFYPILSRAIYGLIPILYIVLNSRKIYRRAFMSQEHN